MLFLAVFCGFLAENLREHRVESRWEKTNMKNMLEDLKSDTASYKKYARGTALALNTADSLIHLLKSPERNAYVNKIYFLARIFTMRADLLITNERTYDQMKSSGHLRLIHSRQISDSVSYYYNSLKEINNQNERITERINQYFLTMNKLFDAELLLKIYKEKKEPEGLSAKLLSDDPIVINEVLTRAQYLYSTFSTTQSWGLGRCKKAVALIEMIKKEYHLE